MSARRSSRFCILLLCLAATPALRAAADAGQPGAYLRAGVGARAASMGDAAAACIEGPDAAYWNPAALAWGRRPAISSTVSLLSLGRRFNSAGLLLAWSPADAPPADGSFDLAQRSGIGAWGLTWLDFSLGDDFEGRSSDTASYYSFSDRQSAYLFSHGRPLTPWLAVGAGLKVYERQLERYSAHGLGLDLGLLLLLGPSVRLGVSGSDLFGGLQWSTGYQERIPALIRSSLSALLFRRVELAVQAAALEGRAVDLGVGAEITVYKGFFARGGWQADGPTAGAGVELTLSSLLLSLSYAYLPDPLKQGDSQKIELTVVF